MTRHKNILFLPVLSVWFLVSLVAVAAAAEPQRPDVTRLLDAGKELKINQIYGYSSTAAFEEMKGVEFLADDDFLNKAVYQAFHRRKGDAIELALQALHRPIKEFADGAANHRAKDVYVARKIFEVFPDESISPLRDRYRSGDPSTRGNVVRACGGMYGTAAGELLREALDDKAFSDPVDPEIEGPPMRVCDLAYNQLVLRYRIRGVLRTIGPNDRIENREYHIAVLKTKL